MALPLRSLRLEPTEPEAESDEPAVPQTMSLLDIVEEAEKKTESSIGVSAEAGKGALSSAYSRPKGACLKIPMCRSVFMT